MDWKFWKKKEAPAPVPVPALNLVTPITRMKWVWCQEAQNVGIVTRCDGDGMVNVDLVKEDGTTFSSVRTAAGNIRIAKLAEIPVSRRPNTEAEANLLGYY